MKATMREAWFLKPAGREGAGSATVGWFDDAIVVFRWRMLGDVAPATADMVLVIGCSDAHEAYSALHHDERGVCRVYAMTFDGSRWTLNREDPDMFQRHVADVGPDRIEGRWEASDDRGSTWRKDFDLVLERQGVQATWYGSPTIYPPRGGGFNSRVRPGRRIRG